MNIEQMIDIILQHEGGYINHPNDPGGHTNFGVTLQTLKNLRIDVNGDGRIDSTDVKLLPIDTARRIYKEKYYYAPRINALPLNLQPSVFDMNVNAGSASIKILQTILQVDPDGRIGPITAAAAHAAPTSIVNDYAVARRNWYYDLADRRPQLRVFATTSSGKKGGWIRRAESFADSSIAYTQQQHELRTAKW
jgi:lysozyme family protein